jgi:hypothetical protein
MSRFIQDRIDEYNADPSYKNAIILAGALEPITIAARSDDYWTEQVNKGRLKTFDKIAKDFQ